MTSYEPDPRRWRAFSVSLVAGFMSLLDVSIVSVALPSLQHGLGTSAAGAQWVVSGYALAFGLALVPAGRLGDALGRRTVFLVAMSGFVLFSALAGLAPTAGVLIAARLAQGVAAGALAPQNSALIQQLFRGAERGRAFGWFGATVGISTAVGPVVGGVILAVAGEDDGWRWVFYVNVPIGLAALVLAARLLPRAADVRRRDHLDLVGAALLGSGVLAVMLPLVLAESGGLSSLWWLFLLGAVVLVGFVRWERRERARGRSPLLDIGLFTTTPGYGTGALLGLVYFIGFSGIWLVFAVYFQSALEYSPLESGLAVTPFAVGSAVSALIGGRLVETWGRRLTVTGLGMVVAGLALTAFLLWLTDGYGAGVAVALFVAGVGGGWVISPNTTLTLRHVPVAMAGAAGGALQTGQRIGSAVGTAALAGLYHAVLTGAQARVAVGVAVGTAAVAVTAALVVGIVELRARPTCPRAREAGVSVSGDA
ncbi:MFS transporter [Saccharothrix violaceirubra]|uniref:EmrB/QacA subfamily drug resistance transporter n=1 Tax=Saccharothrix violaceirubra TaxID=413306 RepID=A0A7W7T500_9PSEU|nr:MFS transporter [Saccharothrix violaceirubra]MBB4966637.1 EmrB/QacA subfamily drug resistance transporter [Saccharothrix violaceirubra]